MGSKLNYNGDFTNTFSLSETRSQVFINALAITKTIEDAALQAGVGERTIQHFTKKNNITYNDIVVMRTTFRNSGKKVKLRKKEDHIKEQIKEGYIAEDGHPLKCECGCVKFKEVDQHFGSGHIEEYSLECTNNKCLKIVGSWSFGHWQI